MSFFSFGRTAKAPEPEVPGTPPPAPVERASSVPAPPRASQSAKIVRAIDSNVTDVEAWTKHTAQLTAVLGRVQERLGREKAAAREEIGSIQARCDRNVWAARLEGALAVANMSRSIAGANRAFKKWAGVARELSEEHSQAQRERLEELQRRVWDHGRKQLHDEYSALRREAVSSSLEAQAMRAQLDARSQELERTMLRDTLTHDLWAADAGRLATKLNDARLAHERDLERANEEAAALRLLGDTQKAASAEEVELAQRAVATTLGDELASAEERVMALAMGRAFIVREASTASLVHRCWTRWAVAASLLLRDAREERESVELGKQQQRTAHAQACAAMQADVAALRVENLEARQLLRKAGVLSQLAPTNKMATNAEMLAHVAAELAKSQAEVEALRKRESEHEAVRAELVETKQRLGDALLARNTWIEEERKTAAKERADSVLHGRSAAQDEHRESVAGLARARAEVRALARSLAEADHALATQPTTAGARQKVPVGSAIKPAPRGRAPSRTSPPSRASPPQAAERSRSPPPTPTGPAPSRIPSRIPQAASSASGARPAKARVASPARATRTPQSTPVQGPAPPPSGVQPAARRKPSPARGRGAFT